MNHQAHWAPGKAPRPDGSVFRLMTEYELQFDVAAKIIAGAKIEM
jgi:hypothetical protein